MKRAAGSPPTAEGARTAKEVREALLVAAERLDGLARRLRRNQDFLGEWTVRSLAWELTMCANSKALSGGGKE